MLSYDSKSQNSSIANDLLRQLEEKDLPDSVLFEINNKLGFFHPSPISMLKYGLEAFEIATRMKSPLRLARSLEVTSQAYRLCGEVGKSYRDSYKALDLFDSLGMQNKRAGILLQIAANHVEDENYEEAIVYYRESELSYDLLGDKLRAAYANINMSEAFRLTGDLDTAVQCLSKALFLNREISDSVVRAYSLGNLGMIHSVQSKLGDAIEELAEAVKILEVLGDPASVVIYDAEIGQLLIKQGKEEEGISKIVTSFELAKSENLKEQIKELSKMLTILYSERAQFDQAYFYQQQYQAYQDSLVNPASIREIEQAKSDYEKNQLKQESALELAASRRKIGYIILVVILLALLVAVVYYAYVGKKKTNYQLSLKNRVIGAQILEKELLHKEMHHRVKNNLQLISSIMGLHANEAKDQNVSNAISEGKSRMEAMTLIHQKLYGKEEASFIELKSYLDNLIGNLKSTYSGQIADIKLEALALNVEADDSIPIGLIVNEAVCNAAKYGKDSNVLVEVSLRNLGTSYELRISDNGPGFPEKAVKPGFGTMLISTLAKQLRAKLEVVNLSPGTAIVLNFDKLKLGNSIQSLNKVTT